MTGRVRGGVALFALSASLLGSCAKGTTAVKVCTQIGCVSGVIVVVDGAGAGQVTSLAASAPGDTAIVRNCTPTTPCTGALGVVFSDFTPDTVVITVVTATGTTSVTFVPSYTLFSPNGPDCPPTCKLATVYISVPG